MGTPLVAIVGRPNVGKSTLFNRLIGRRKAIVDDQPGVTRDRNYDTLEWNGQEIGVIDTGGYLPKTHEHIDLAVREQVEIAVDEADLILFVVDAKTGITDIDEDLASILLQSNKKTLLVVNKVDSVEWEYEIGQFYNLGLGEPIPVSAITGKRSGDLLDLIIEHIRAVPARDMDEDYIKLAIIGRENVGKSSFVNTLLSQPRAIVTDIPGTTRDPIDSFLNYKKRKYLLIDTAGLKKRKRIKENVLFYSNVRTYKSMQRADVVLYMVDVNEGLTHHDITVLNEAARQQKGIVLVMNKWDLIAKDHKTIEYYTAEINDRLGNLNYIPQIYVSVLEKQRLYKTLDLATEVYEERKKRIPTSELNEFFLPLVQTTLPPAVRGKEIKINYVTQARANPPLIVFFSNHPDLIMDSYKRFLENKLRERFGFKGVPLRVVFRKKNK
ncbi:GTP-binding protein engA [Caldithrix abyssi DSM 13497]|uniref:GTPase Der n=1 Tax=Caldithrix abyssi DSM 13497 TaxID=880073 RepID=H1XXS3_CALAY|nr:ribosome biogenesis GTPase Der [Caldithrix abyssi]APF19625.1 der GTP-binding protein [Caldithrix abyssi DSM 13497]EHO39746.1 GTP-binding protein engA [Caldithrix abyssi DSM 13497]